MQKSFGQFDNITLSLSQLRCYILLMILSMMFLIIIFQYNILFYENNLQRTSTATDLNKSSRDYILSSPNCKIRNRNPFNEVVLKFHHHQDYISCSKLPLLTYVTKRGQNFKLHIKSDLIALYAENGIKCCYRGLQNYTQFNVTFSNSCNYFKNKITINEEVIKVTCKDENTSDMIYENVHNIIRKKAPLKPIKSNKRPISVLIFGIDSLSRLSFIRNFPQVARYLTLNGWLSLNGYSRVADNTFPNLMALLTGYSLKGIQTMCPPTASQGIEKCPSVQNDFRKAGYITAFAEDCMPIATFESNSKFTGSFFDHYFTPYMLAAESLGVSKVDDLNYCSGPETSGERIMNLAIDFATRYNDTPYFGLFWTNSFSHNEYSVLSGMDVKVKGFFERLTNIGVFENAIGVFLSDHGLRFGGLRSTFEGWFEENHPLMYLSVPDWFQFEYGEEFYQLKENVNKLTTHVDLHMTLQHILLLSGVNHTIRPPEACIGCKSVFSEIDQNRSCEDVSIEPHFCPCYDFRQVDANANKNVIKAANFIVNQINKVVAAMNGTNICVFYNLDKIIRASQYEEEEKTYFLVAISTNPYSEFESTVILNNRDGRWTGSFISRINVYRSHKCVLGNKNLKMYCFCKNLLR